VKRRGKRKKGKRVVNLPIFSFNVMVLKREGNTGGGEGRKEKRNFLFFICGEV